MKWIKTVRRPYPPLFSSLMHEAWLDKKLWLPYLDFEYTMDGALKVDHCWFYPESHMKDFAQKLAQHLFNNQAAFEKLKAESLKNEKLLIQAVKTDFHTFCSAYKKHVITIVIYFIIDDLIEEKIRSLLAQKTSKENVNKIMEELAIPLEDNFYKLEKLNLLKDDLQTHLKEFAWIKSRYGQVVEYTLKDAEEFKKELIKKNYLKEYHEEKQKIKKATEEAKQLLQENAFLIDLMQFFIYYRTQRTDILNQAIFLAWNLIAQEAHQHGFTYDDFLYCTYQEIINQDFPRPDIIEKRKKGHAIYTALGNQPKVLIGKENQEMIEKYLQVDTAINQVQGRAAFIGKVQGPVVLVKQIEDLNKVKPGSVLVTSMTTPEMTVALDRAAAFVTDEGGITCHAAIIAREMQKPCIIGTKIASRIFKDGDLIEVDAEKGIVKKIK
ncbi:MAG: hypothetical protein KAT77_05740 [Nanoarchaeota archaeon]|nr:hypothetical protein [Nanoarchaeota archaeon]